MTVLNFLAGLVCGVLSGFGIGGGSLLLIYMTEVPGLDQTAAQGINLVYFLPASAAAVYSHWKNKLIEIKLLLWTAVPGSVCAFLAAMAATSLDSLILRRFFGIFCSITGVKMLFTSKKS